MYCDKCGTVLWHDASPGQDSDRGYCHRCDPPEVKILPLAGLAPESPNSFDISPEDLLLAQPCPAPDLVTYNSSSTNASTPNVNAPSPSGQTTTGGAFPPISSIDFGDTVLMTGGIPILAYEDLPKDAAEGALAYISEQSAAYVFDGDEWQNLGKVARLLNGKDAKCDRRAAVAATKAKEDV